MSTTPQFNSQILPILKPLIIEGKKEKCLTVDHYIKACPLWQKHGREATKK